MGEFLLLSLLLYALVLAALYGLLWLAARLVHPMLAAVLGGAMIAWLAYATFNGFRTCAAPPVYVPPAPGDLGDGAMIFACDSAGGAFTYLGLTLSFPIMAALAFVTYRIWRSSRNRRARVVGGGA